MKAILDTIQSFGATGWAVAGGIALGLALLIGIWFVRRFLYICTPNQVLIFSGGGKQRLPDGTERGFRPVFGGRGWRKPFIEKVSRMSLNLMEVPIHVRGAYSKGGVPLIVEAIANVKISSDPRLIGNAIERFLGRNPEEIRRVAKETLEGHLRGVVAKTHARGGKRGPSQVRRRVEPRVG